MTCGDAAKHILGEAGKSGDGTEVPYGSLSLPPGGKQPAPPFTHRRGGTEWLETEHVLNDPEGTGAEFTTLTDLAKSIGIDPDWITGWTVDGVDKTGDHQLVLLPHSVVEFDGVDRDGKRFIHASINIVSPSMVNNKSNSGGEGTAGEGVSRKKRKPTFTKQHAKENREMLEYARQIVPSIREYAALSENERDAVLADLMARMKEAFPEVKLDRIRTKLSRAMRLKR